MHRTNTPSLNLSSQLVDNHSQHPSIILSPYTQEIIQLLTQLFSSPVNSQMPLWFDDPGLEKYNKGQLSGSNNSPILLQQPQTSGFTTPSPLISNHPITFTRLLTEIGNKFFLPNSGWESFSVRPDLMKDQEVQSSNNVIDFDRKTGENSSVTRQQSDTLLKQRHIELELLKRAVSVAKKRFATIQYRLQLSQEQLDEHQATTQMQITSLQQSLDMAQYELEQERKSHRKREQVLKTTLDKMGRSADEDLKRAEDKMLALTQQIDATELSCQQLQQEKQNLARCLQLEITRMLQTTQQAQILNEQIQSLGIELKATKKTNQDAERLHKNAMDSIREELEAEKRHTREEQARFEALIEGLNQQLAATRAESERKLDEAQQQAQAHSLMLQQRMNLALEAERQHTKEEQLRFEALIEGLNQQLAASRAEADRQLDDAQQQAQADAMKLQQQMNLALEAEKQHTKEEQVRFEALIEGLNQQLAASRAEADRQLEEAQQQAQADAMKLQQRMNLALEAERQHTKEEQARFEAVVENLNQQLEANHAEADRQLDEMRQQAQADSEMLQQQMDLALEAQQQQAREEQARLETVIEGLNKELEKIRTEADWQRDQRIKQETLLAKERNNSDRLQLLLKRSKKALKVKRQRIEELTHIHQETLSDLQQELESSQIAWEQATDSEVASQLAKQELSALKSELQEEIINLRAQLEHQQESSAEILHKYTDENKQLQKSLSEIKDAEHMTDITIRSLKNDRDTLHEAKSELETKFTKLQTEFLINQTDHSAIIESMQQEKASLIEELEAAKAQNKDPEALRRAENENNTLKREIEGLREVQLEMERQLNEDTDIEIRELRTKLEVTETKLKKAEPLAQQADKLLREQQTQENAIEMLTEDLEALTKENEALILERDKLKSELSEIQG